MKSFTVFSFLLFASLISRASDTLEIKMNKLEMLPGETLSFEANYQPWATTNHSGTLNLWIEDIQHRVIGKFRYPMLKGNAVGQIVLPPDLPDNMYACYFSLQDDFFAINGRIVSPYNDKKVKLTMMFGEKEFLSQEIVLDENKEFHLKKLLFADQAKVFFSPVKAHKENDLEVEMEITLDSSFNAHDDQLVMLKVGQVPTGEVVSNYQFDPEVFSGGKSTLKDVEVIGAQRTQIDFLEDTRVNGIFKAQDAYQFEGVESNQFIGSLNLLEWLNGRIPGLIIRPKGDLIGYKVNWQGGETFFFWNEMQVDAQTIATIPMAEIAYVKVFRPPFYGAYLGGPGGAIAVYSKNGSQLTKIGHRNKFLVNGYTPENFSIPHAN